MFSFFCSSLWKTCSQVIFFFFFTIFKKEHYKQEGSDSGHPFKYNPKLMVVASSELIFAYGDLNVSLKWETFLFPKRVVNFFFFFLLFSFWFLSESIIKSISMYPVSSTLYYFSLATWLLRIWFTLSLLIDTIVFCILYFFYWAVLYLYPHLKCIISN